jgi:hypothetical protein
MQKLDFHSEQMQADLNSVQRAGAFNRSRINFHKNIWVSKRFRNFADKSANICHQQHEDPNL